MLQESKSNKLSKGLSFHSSISDDSESTIIQELQSKLQMKQAYVQYVSHEIHTPLQMISAGLSLLRDDLKDKLSLCEVNAPSHSLKSHDGSDISYEQTNSEVEQLTPVSVTEIRDIKLSFAADELRQDLELVEIMHDSTLTAVSILNDLLLYEKVESNMLVIEQKSVHIFDTVVPAVKMFTVQASYAGVALTWDLDSLMSVYALLDVSKFGQVMRNLISNAIKFTPRGGSVHVSAVKITEPTPPSPQLQSVFDDSTCVSSKGPRCLSLPAIVDASESLSPLPCEINHVVVFSSKSLKGPVAQPSPPANALPPTYPSPSSKRGCSIRSSSLTVAVDGVSSPATPTAAAAAAAADRRVSASTKSLDTKQEPAKPTMYRISVTDSGCGIAKVCRHMVHTQVSK